MMLVTFVLITRAGKLPNHVFVIGTDRVFRLSARACLCRSLRNRLHSVSARASRFDRDRAALTIEPPVYINKFNSLRHSCKYGIAFIEFHCNRPAID